MRHRLLFAVGLIGVTVLTGGAYYIRHGETSPEITTAPVSRGSIVSVVAASATVEPVTTVRVGTQASGTIQTLLVDFNSDAMQTEARR